MRPLLALLVWGLVFGLALLIGGLWLGGGFSLGRADPLLALPVALGAALLFVAWQRRDQIASARLAVVSAVAGTAMALLIFLPVTEGWALLAPPDFWQRGLMLLVATAAALFLALLLLPRVAALATGWRWFIIALTAFVWWLSAHVAMAQMAASTFPAQAGRLVVLTGLPLVQWSGEDGPGFREDAALSQLRRWSGQPIVLRDALDDGDLRPEDRLLLAHPRALPPGTLVEIDRFVRAGGKAVVLADGLSAWPSPHPLGDPRNPPITSLLTPLLAHWGVELAAPDPASVAAGSVDISVAGRRLALHSPGHFTLLSPECRAQAGLAQGKPVLVRCALGRGEALILADADLLFAPLWQANPPWALHLRPADNMVWLAVELAAGPKLPLRGN